MVAERLLMVLGAFAVGGCTVPFCTALPENCAAEDGTTDTDSDSDTTGSSETTGSGDGDGDGDGDGYGDGDGDPPDAIVYADNPAEDYTRVDRMGMPAINTVLLAVKDDYNAANPTDDASLMFLNEINTILLDLHAALDDDVMDAGLIVGSVPMCMGQAQPLIVPDTLKIDLEQEGTFPNGRALTDPVIDVTLAVLMLDLSAPNQDITTLVGVLNPTANDVSFSDAFPYLAPPH
ncbi:hypothetical protein DB30_06217 [Enhygromyxa salina]|uniref:DUF4331 domain-containing protein n=1 Tax=Enhygromyxa salina TaxID=215803 RepID=A0A0C2CZ46_9BACT|nr:DUF4331 family protein [Enhygromyxa salina]KIG14915.1 hypothetical protein DB30_06217 [Enhygromyxa salina]